MKKYLFILIAVFCLTSCEQVITREYGGTTTIKLEPGKKLIEATWKDGGNIWYLTEPMDSNYIPNVKIFTERSLYRQLEGKVIFIETR